MGGSSLTGPSANNAPTAGVKKPIRKQKKNLAQSRRAKGQDTAPASANESKQVELQTDGKTLHGATDAGPDLPAVKTQVPAERAPQPGAADPAVGDAAVASSSLASSGTILGRGQRRGKAPAWHQDCTQIGGKRSRQAGVRAAPASKRVAVDEADLSTETTAVIPAANSTPVAMGLQSPQSMAAGAPPAKRARSRKGAPARASE
eukprot:jgi/Ulvmu1/9421/UM051_0049.1